MQNSVKEEYLMKRNRRDKNMLRLWKKTKMLKNIYKRVLVNMQLKDINKKEIKLQVEKIVFDHYYIYLTLLSQISANGKLRFLIHSLVSIDRFKFLRVT